MTIATLGIFSSSIRRDASRAFARAAFTAGSLGGSTATRRAAMMSRHTAAFTTTSSFTNSNKFTLYAESRREMSAAATDQELDSVLDEILGETLQKDDADEEKEAEKPAADVDDLELESALDEILGEVLQEAENPAVDAEVGGRGHIEGSHPFPKELVEVVRSSLLFG